MAVSMSTVGLVPYSITNVIVCLTEFISLSEDVKGNIIHWTLPFTPTPATIYNPPLSLYPLHISSDATQKQDVLNQVSCCLLGLHVLWFSVSTDCMPWHNLPISQTHLCLTRKSRWGHYVFGGSKVVLSAFSVSHVFVLLQIPLGIKRAIVFSSLYFSNLADLCKCIMSVNKPSLHFCCRVS